jgi:protein-disulfide isomerase-like protein with CxxC motif
MKKMLVTTLLFSFLALVSFAQERREMKPKRHHPDAGMAQKLNLSGEQKAAAKQQREAFKKQMQDLKNNESITVKEFRDQREVLLRSNKAKMQHLLTDGQKAILEKQRAEVQAKREGMHTEKLKKLQEKIGLSNEQFEQLKAQHEATIKERKEIMENQSLSRIERK